MAHRTSAPALHAARTVLKSFDLSVVPPDDLPSGSVRNLRADVTHLAVLIDLMTNVFEIAGLRPELRYWQTRLYCETATAPQVMNFFQKCVDAFEKIPVEPENSLTMMFEMPREARGEKIGGPNKQVISKAAQEAARGVLHYYRVASKSGLTDAREVRARLLKTLEASLGISRTYAARDLLKTWKTALGANRATLKNIKKCLREVGVIMEYLPNYENREEEQILL